MANLVLFGDSFCAEYTDTDGKYIWWKETAKTLGLGINNYALRGSSLNYATVKYYEYLQNSYSADDIIIFVVTSSGRSPLVHPDFSPESSAILQLFSTKGFSFENVEFPPSLKEHYNEHKSFYETWFQFYNPELHKSQVNLIREALNGLSNKKLLINAFDEARYSDFARPYHFHLDGYMRQISHEEFATEGEYSRNRIFDTRPNHISEDNHKIFCDYVLKCLDGNYKSMLEVNFKKGFLNAQVSC
jgi:hypothetical protein